jgi:hypothetical protein
MTIAHRKPPSSRFCQNAKITVAQRSYLWYDAPDEPPHCMRSIDQCMVPIVQPPSLGNEPRQPHSVLRRFSVLRVELFSMNELVPFSTTWNPRRISSCSLFGGGGALRGVSVTELSCFEREAVSFRMRRFATGRNVVLPCSQISCGSNDVVRQESPGMVMTPPSTSMARGGMCLGH